MNDLTFEVALERLEGIVERLQRDDIPLDEAVSLFNEGTQLAARCDELLTGAELRIQQLTRAVQERFASYDIQVEEEAGPGDELID